MNNEEKILELLEKLNTRMENLESGQAALEGHLERIKSDQTLTNLRLGNLEHRQAAFEGRIGRFETALTDLQDGISGLKEDGTTLKDAQTQTQEDITSLHVILELDIDKRLKAIAEGQGVLEMRMDALDEVRELAEKTADRVDVIHAVVTQHSASITELKKVQ